MRETGGIAKAATVSGAAHARRATDALAAFLHTLPEPALPGPRRPHRPGRCTARP
ncbi:hypothetical protein GCM10010358_83460 [Streptomyces minutiscleroticus]|uniref:Uncharacterized protein n=1 Tax=Streptomyces minutiscleroticus TaxID=68238 RepID=A0A918UB34_9ACTN|nr:hypothetical protein [Streptomyces minutiscleroticus]GGY20617.1 hypothetical protein GCM10010358_83460 [Streptomyces minutiscleroticus]